MDTTRVLNLVKENKITIEQADELLKALMSAQINAPSGSSEFEPKAPSAPRPSKTVGKGPYSFAQMIELGKFGISPSFIQELAEVGVSNLSFEEVIEFGKFGVSADFIREMQNLSEEFGMEELDSHIIIELSKFGVNSNYVREMIQSGMVDASSLRHGLRTTNHENLDGQREKLQKKLAKAQTKLALATDKTSKVQLQEMIDELEAELFDLQDQEREILEHELEQEVNT